MYELTYRRPASLDEALALLGEDGMASVVSGGQTLMPVLRARLAMPSQLVDLAWLDELRGIRVEGDTLRRALLTGTSDELLADAHRGGVRDAVVHRDGNARAGVAGERHGAVGEREDDASMRYPEPVHHLRAHCHA